MLAQEQRQRHVGQAQRRNRVDCDLGLDLAGCRRIACKVIAEHDPGAVHQNVETLVIGFDLVQHRLALIGIGDIARNCARVRFRGRGRQLVLVAPAYDDRIAQTCKGGGDLGADTGPAPRYQYDFFGQGP